MARASLANRQAGEVARLYRGMQWTYRRIAAKLNASEYTTRRGCRFTAAGVRRLVLGLSAADSVIAITSS